MNTSFSILIPTWNNLPYLKLCVESLRKHSDFPHQIIVMVNEGTDGSLEWVSSQSDLEYIASPKNIGICYGLNVCRPLIKKNYVVYANDDMYFLPHWDLHLSDAITQAATKDFMLSATMIEPQGNNPCCVIADYGNNLENFQEMALLQAVDNLVRDDWSGSTWPPVLVPLSLWDKVGGMSIEFSPGMYSDPDLSRKLWECGVRHFQGVGSSLVYHFGSKSTKRVKKNKGRHTYLLKWRFSANLFMHQGLHIGEKFHAPLPDFEPNQWKRFTGKLKLISTVIKTK